MKHSFIQLCTSTEPSS